MPCEEIRELENAWKRHYESANYFERSPEIAALPMAKKTLTLLIRECRSEQARAAHSMLAHRRRCAVCGERKQKPGRVPTYVISSGRLPTTAVESGC